MKNNRFAIALHHAGIVFCFLMLLCIMPNTVNAQDKIHKTNNTILEVKVTEINDTEIKYKYFNNQNGPTYAISISEVYMIVYENGEKEIYNAPKEKPVTPPTPTAPVNTNPTPVKTNSDDNGSFKRFYFTLGSGYNMSAASKEYDESKTYTSMSSYEAESVSGSFGKGLNSGISVGFMINKTIGFECGVNYLKSGNITTTVKNDFNINTQDITNKRSATMLRVIPAVVFSASNGNVKPYARVGLVIGLSAKLTAEYTDDGTAEEVKTTEFSGNTAYGAASAIGLKFGSKNISFFGELNMINQAWAPAKSVITTYTKNGIDVLPLLSTSKTETEYVDTFTIIGTPVTPNTDVPAQSSKKHIPFSSFGVNIGIRLSL